MLKNNITGYIDSFDGNTISGWVHDPECTDPIDVLAIIDGTKKVNVIADKFRDDLAQAGFNGGFCAFELQLDGDYHGFDITLVAKSASKKLYFNLTEDTEFPVMGSNSTEVVYSFPKHKAFVDRFKADFIAGWAVNLTNGNLPVSIVFCCDGVEVGSVIANQYREDLDAAGYVNGFCAFEFPLSQYISDGKDHHISVFADIDGEHELIAEKNMKLNLSLTKDDELRGNLERPLEDKVRGWVEVIGKEDLKPLVDLFIDNNHIGTIAASLFRKDVRDNLGNSGHCGFEFPIPLMFKDGKSHSVIAQVQTVSSFSFSKRTYKSKLALNSLPELATTDIKRHPDYKGNIEKTSANGLLRGWAATSNKNGKNGSTVTLFVNGKRVSNIIAKIFRADLGKLGINDGFGGFEFPVPLSFMDGEKRIYQLRDETGEYLISEREIAFSINRDYTDFDGYLKWSFFHREVRAPFREEDKRCFAYMDWLEKFYTNRYLRQFESQEQTPLISIVMPAYNREFVIETAIQSVLGQSYYNWELIIVDDGSEDNTAAKVQSLSDRRIKLHKLDGNFGVSFARNKALSLCQGEYIAYLDTDNTWKEHFLTIMVGSLENNKTYDSAYCAQYLYKKNDTPYAIRFGLFNRTLLENRNYIDMNAFVHRATLVVEKGGFDLELRRLVDWDLILRYTEDKKPLAVKSILSHYFYNDGEETITVSENYQDALAKLSARRSENKVQQNLNFDAINFIADGDDAFAPLTTVKDLSEVNEQRIGVSIILVSYNIPKIFETCVQSIMDTTDADLTELIIVDNCSDKETVAVVEDLRRRFSNISVIYNQSNAGFTAAVNQGIQLAKPDNNIVLINNDAIATHGWLTALEDVTIRHSDAGIVSPQQVLLPKTKTINTHIPYADNTREIDVTVSAHHKNLVLSQLENAAPEFEVNFIPFFCVYITRETLNKIGLLDEKLGRHYRSDRLYCYSTLYNAEKKIYFTPKSKLYHLHQQSTSHLKKKDDSEFEIMFVKNSWEHEKENPIWDF